MPVAGRDLIPIDALFDVEQKESGTGCLLSLTSVADPFSGPFAVRHLGRLSAAKEHRKGMTFGPATRM
jgi:hypothetical protein